MRNTNHPPAFMQIKMLSKIVLFCLSWLLFKNGIGQDPTSANNNSCNHFLIGPSTIFEDNGSNRFNTFGIDAAYTHPVSSRLGITGDGGIYFGSNEGFKYTKVQLLGGVSLLPANTNNKVLFYPHVLAGFSNLTSKYKTQTNSFSNNSTHFSMAAGSDVVFPVNDKFSWGLKGEINPTFIPAKIKWNIGFGGGIYIKFGCNKSSSTPHTTSNVSEKVCEASKTTKELKISFIAIENAIKEGEKIANNIPRVEAKINCKPQLTVKRGEECCAKDKPPVTYTELKGGVEGSFEININLWGIPDINYSLKLWPVLLVAEFKCKLFVGPTGKINIDGVGKFYGELDNPVSYQPQCSSCWYLNLKAEGFTRLGVKVGGDIKIFHWSPFGEGKAGFDVNGEPDEKIEASAEASVSLGATLNGTYRSSKGCEKPAEGLHGTLNIGKAKANLKFNLKLGPISFDPNFEVNLFDGIEISL